MADYWNHWLKIGQFTDASKLPRIYSVNWFRKDGNGKFLWPGFGENSRVLAWIVDRLEGKVEAQDTPIGRIPLAGDIDVTGLGLTEEHLAELFAIDPATWSAEAQMTSEYFDQFGTHAPAELYQQLESLKGRLASV